MLKKTLLAALVSCLGVTAAHANPYQPNGYLFGNIGQADASASKIRNGLDAQAEEIADFFGLDQGRRSFDEKDSAFKIGAGIQLNQHVAVEFQYLDLGKLSYKAQGVNTFDGTTASLKGSAATDGFGANLVGTLPFDRFKLFGKVGYHKLKTKGKLSVDIAVPEVGTFAVSESESTTEWVTSYGLGASYAFTQTVELVAEYERYQDVADEYDVNFASVGLRYNF